MASASIAALAAGYQQPVVGSIDLAGVVALLAFTCVLVAQLLVEMYQPQAGLVRGTRRG